jgi:hypothetical protein
MKVLAVVACLASAACTTPAPPPHAGPQMSTYDMNTEYTSSYTADGFTLMVNYRYERFTVRSSVAAAQCKAVLASVANSLAERRQRPIEPVNEQSISLATSRNWYGKVAACSATAPIAWKR